MKKSLVFAFALSVCALGSVWAQDAVIRSGDAFDLRISGVPADDQSAITGNYTVDGLGFLNLTYLPKLKVSGKTPSEIQSMVERTYMEMGIFTHPTVALTIAPSARFVNVGGPGVKGGVRIAYTSDMTMLSAIVAAGDFNEFANQRTVRLIRDGKVQIIDCKKLRANPSKDIPVRPGDNIQVDQTIF